MEFHLIDIKDKKWIQEHLREADFLGCYYSFGTMILWKELYETSVTECEGMFCYRYFDKEAGQYYYAFPAGANEPKAAIEALRAEARKAGTPFVLTGVEDLQVEWLKENYANEIDIFTTEDAWDYVYDREALATLRGSKYQAKRNHIKRFMDNPDWHYEKMNFANMQDCKKMSEIWYKQQEEKGNTGVLPEKQVLANAFQYFDELNLTGGVLYQEGQVVAFTIGEVYNDEVYHVHIEKAYADIQGAYPMINQQYVVHEMEGFRFVNREEDMGEPGLRKAKQSYGPAFMVKKYKVVFK